jgi:cyclic pyranopterin phosphate synthase
MTDKNMKMPQLRILVTSFCGRSCIYCRPTGEGLKASGSTYNDINNIVKIVRLYKKYGGAGIKLTGGDPVLWTGIVDCVNILKNEIGIPEIELITRSPNITSKIDLLIKAGIGILNFSLDTVDHEKYRKVTGTNDFEKYIDAIKFCVQMNIKCKINSVIMKSINENDIDPLISFCEKNNIKQLKLLDIITDLHDTENNNASILSERHNCTLENLYLSLSSISEKLNAIATRSDIISQGGLGHPMNYYVLPSGLEVVIKNSENGAWYHRSCRICPQFPCHDALMALRLTSDNKLQFCLLNENNCIDLNGLDDKQIEEKFVLSLQFYKDSYFKNNIYSKEIAI